MNFQTLVSFIITVGLCLWAVKVSAELAYKKDVPWDQAFLQGLLLLVLIFAITIFLNALRIKSIF